MKKRLAAFIFIITIGSTVHAQSSLKVVIEGLKKPQGHMYIGVYNKDKTFKNVDSVYHKLILPVDSLNFTTTIENLPKGEYALTLFQDVNDNGKLDKNFIGVPKEPYGFSNNPKFRFKPPNFEKCRIALANEEEVEVIIEMKNVKD